MKAKLIMSSPKLKHNKEMQHKLTTSSHACSNTNVVGSQNLVGLVSKRICDVDEYLKKVNEYIEKCKNESG